MLYTDVRKRKKNDVKICPLKSVKLNVLNKRSAKNSIQFNSIKQLYTEDTPVSRLATVKSI